MDLHGKTAIITGGGRGIGRAIALDLAKEGCNLVIAARSASELDAVVKEAEAAGGKALGIALDLSVAANAGVLVDTAVGKFGTVDVLINNAGVLINKHLMETSLEEWDATMNLNLRTCFCVSQRVMRIMIEKKQGHIINISTGAAIRCSPWIAAYAISKRAMEGLSHALHDTGKEHNVKVSTVYPGYVDTAMLRGMMQPERPGQWMLPEDISYCVMFLLKQSGRMEIEEIVATATGHE